MAKVVLNIRIEDSEMDLLESFCQSNGRTKTEVVRSLLRELKRKMKDKQPVAGYAVPTQETDD